MTIPAIGIILALVLFLLLASGFWVSFTLMGVALLGMFLNGNDWGFVASGTVWGGISVWSLTSLPMFLWMGEILFRTNLSRNLFDGLSVWLEKIPGKLYHANILGCGIFAAVCGSSAATVATIGKINLENLGRLGYAKSLSYGTIGGAGTLGLLIPPSIVFIVYGVAADVSIARLFMAGFFPGLLLIGLFSLYVVVYCLIYPESVPKAEYKKYTFFEKIQATLKLFPVLGLILGVIGSIYAGLATPNEAAALGVAGALILGFFDGSLTRKSFLEGVLATVNVNAMLLFIIASANVLSVAMAFIGIPRELAMMISELHIGQGTLLILLGVLFLVLGCFLDGISIILLTTSVILPIIVAAEIDLIWFGVYLVLLVEIAQITPPVGFNLFILQSLTKENIFRIMIYTLPFFLLILLCLFLIWLFPPIVTYLPSLMER